MTPMRVRGKRGATSMEKWNYGKQRKPVRSRASSERNSSVLSSSFTGKSSRQRKGRQLDPHLSRLEQLPTEIIHAIFEFSANPDLPLTSPRLASQLESRHLYYELTCRILRPLAVHRAFSQTEMRNAMRLMNSKFFTWQFFKGWMDEEEQIRSALEKSTAPFATAGVRSSNEVREGYCVKSWKLNLRILPPRKLLKGPFTEDKLRFLQVLSHNSTDRQMDPLDLEFANDGLRQAVADGALDAVVCFLTLGLQPDTELLRQAVIDAGCNKAIVTQLLLQTMRHDKVSTESLVDLLDPSLWTWADKARESGDDKASWFIIELKKALAEREASESLWRRLHGISE